LAYRLIEYADAGRVLFRVDRRSLGRQAKNEFHRFDIPGSWRTFAEVFGIQHLTRPRIDMVSRVASGRYPGARGMAGLCSLSRRWQLRQISIWAAPVIHVLLTGWMSVAMPRRFSAPRKSSSRAYRAPFGSTIGWTLTSAGIREGQARQSRSQIPPAVSSKVGMELIGHARPA
jgi:hypothetical protein